ncbi:MAG: DUF4164 family protein [Cyclobacteriaceae bacterium]
MATETQGKVEEILRELGKKIDDLIVDTKQASEGVKDDIEEKIQDLKERKQKLEDEFNEYKEKEKWQDAKSHFSKALQELKQAVESLFKKT